MKDSLIDWMNYCCERHDKYCNQLYDGTHPYSFHLKNVAIEFTKWQSLLSEEKERRIGLAIAWGHDLIEDARMTYHTIRDVLNGYDIEEFEEIAEGIFVCTDDRGRHRRERKSERYYQGLESNHIALLVKFSDIISNVKYSVLTNNRSMVDCYRREHERYKTMTIPLAFDRVFNYMDILFRL